jgi:hypothetical protein
MKSTNDSLLTTDEAAKRLRTGTATLERWRTLGSGPAGISTTNARAFAFVTISIC